MNSSFIDSKEQQVLCQHFHIIGKVVRLFEPKERLNKEGYIVKSQTIQVCFPNGHYEFNILLRVRDNYFGKLKVGDVGVFYVSGEVKVTEYNHPIQNLSAYKIRLLNRNNF